MNLLNKKETYILHLERKDIEYISKLKKEVNNIINDTIVKCENFYNKFIDINNSKEYKKLDTTFLLKSEYDLYNVQYNLESGDKSTKALYSKVKNKKPIIYIYDTILLKTLTSLRNNITKYLETQNKSYITKAKQSLDNITNYDYKEIKYSLLHEIVHLYDDLKYKFNPNSDSIKIDKELKKHNYKTLSSKDKKELLSKIENDVYINSNEEYNAYFLENISKFIDIYNDKDLPDFNTLIQFLNDNIYNFNKIKPETKERYIKRAYKFYNNFKELKIKQTDNQKVI